MLGYSLFVLGTAALVLALVLTPLCRNLFLHWKLVDLPDSERKLHTKPVPRLGGIALVASYVGAFGVLLLLLPDRDRLFSEHAPMLWKLLPATGLVFAVGLLDDLFGLKPWQKLVGQLAGGLWLYLNGIRITGFAGHSAPEDVWWSLPVTLLWLVGCTNAFNLIDGVDGLASGVGLFATTTTLLAALQQGDAGLAIVTVPLAGCLLGFLRYNFNPASIFLGDCGSLVIGFLLGSYAVIWSEKSATLLGMVAPLMAMAVPLFDVGLSILRRFLRNQPIFGADRGHIHHRLLAHGFTPRGVVLILYAVCGVAASLSLLHTVLYNHLGGAMIVLFCSVSWVGIRHLDYVEFAAVQQMVSAGTFRRLLQEEICLRHLQRNLRSARDIDECWRMIHESCRELGFQRIELQAGDRFFDVQFKPAKSGPIWQFQITLSATERVSLTRPLDGAPTLVVVPFVVMLHNMLQNSTALLTDAADKAVGCQAAGALATWQCTMEPPRRVKTGRR